MQVWVESSNQRNQVLRRCWCSDSMQLTQSDHQLLSWYVRPQALQCRMAVPNGQIPWCPCPQMAASQRQRRWSDVPAEPAIFHQAFHLMWLEFEKSGAGMLISFRDLLWHSEAISEKEKTTKRQSMMLQGTMFSQLLQRLPFGWCVSAVSGAESRLMSCLER